MTRWCLVLGLLGCNQVFGLEETVGPTALDSDGDGLVDEDDNCVLVANRDQHNSDGDTFGDACDPCPLGEQSGVDVDKDGIDDTCDVCPLGVNHDEDGDGIFDGCDACPGISGDQADGDGDGIGDACDPTPAQNRRVFFDSFAPAPDLLWNSGFEVWIGTGEAFTPAGTPSMSSADGPWNRRGEVSGTSWQVSAVVDLPEPPIAGMQVGISVVHETDSFPTPYCQIYFGGDAAWHRTDNDLLVPITFPLRITLEAIPLSSAKLDAECTFNDATYHIAFNLFEGTFFPRLQLQLGRAEFGYVDVVE